MKLEVPPDDAGLRLDLWLDKHLSGLSRSCIQRLIKSGHIAVQGKDVRAHTRVSSGMTVDVEIPPADPVALIGENIPLEVLYEDADIIVVNKPPGMVVHPAAGHSSGTLVHALLYHCDDLGGIGGEMRPGIVHRLDKDTSGAIVVAKNAGAMDALAAQFKQGEVLKEYAALVYGVPAPASGRIQTLIGRSRHDRKKMATSPAVPGITGKEGRLAVTNYELLESFGAVSLLRIRIETGRTHQIRAHMLHLGHPVVGDRQYGRRGLAHKIKRAEPGRQMLHAERLAFRHPRKGTRVDFTAALPDDMENFLTEQRAQPPS